MLFHALSPRPAFHGALAAPGSCGAGMAFSLTRLTGEAEFKAPQLLCSLPPGRRELHPAPRTEPMALPTLQTGTHKGGR